MNNPRKIQLIPDILAHASTLKSKKDKIAYLKTWTENPVLKNVIRMAYNEEVQFSIPSGPPPYSPAEAPRSNLYKENPKIGYLLEGSRVQQLKKEVIFVKMLESLRPDEASLLIAVKDKTMPYDGLTWEIFNEAFPGVLTAKPKLKVKKKVKAKVKQEVKDEEVKDKEEVKVTKPKPTKKQKTSTKKKARKAVVVDEGASDADV